MMSDSQQLQSYLNFSNLRGKEKLVQEILGVREIGSKISVFNLVKGNQGIQL